MARERKQQHNGWRIRGVNLGIVLLLVAALVGINIGITILEKKNGWRLDYSFNGITTQSETTRKVLAELTYPVHIYALFSKGQEDAPLMELLDRYAARSDLVTWEQADPSLNPALLTRFNQGSKNVSADSLIVYCAVTDRWKILSPADFISLSMDEDTGVYQYAGYTYEQALTNSLVYVTRTEIPRIVIVQGHGELDAETLGAFEKLTTSNHYEVVYQNLADANFEPDPKETLVFFSPMRDLTGNEMEKIIRFADRGGSLLFTCDYTDPVDAMQNYSALLRSYGFISKEGIVIADREDVNSYYNSIRIDLIPRMNSTDVTMDLVASGADTVLMPGSCAFETPAGTDRNLTVFSVLQSGETSYLKKLNSSMTSVEKEEGDESGPFSLALQAQRITKDGYISRAFVCGCSGMLTEEQIYAMTDVQEFIIRMMEYLTGVNGSNLEILARNAVRPGISARGNGIGSLIVTILPLTVMLAAAIVLIRRRNR